MLSFRTRGNFIDFVNTDDTSLNVETVLLSLHNTSKCISWSLPEDTSIINFIIDGVEYAGIPIINIDFDGVTMTAQADFKTGIEAMFTGLAGGSSGYLSATVTLTDAQIKALPTTSDTLGGFELVAAQAGKILLPISAIQITDTTAGAYTNISATPQYFKITIANGNDYFIGNTSSSILNEGGSATTFFAVQLFEDTGVFFPILQNNLSEFVN